jgi:hypothetical protein
MMKKALISVAIAVGFCVVGAAPASADSNPASTAPNPFSTLSCNCRESAPAGGPALSQNIDRGIRDGLSSSVPGLPAPAHPGQTRP